MGMMLVNPAVFVAAGVPIERARAEALQAERAEVYRVIGFTGAAQWHRHPILPRDPHFRGSGETMPDPWNATRALSPDDPRDHWSIGAGV